MFSLAAQPGGVRFSYAEDTKAAEKVKVAEATEASDELGIDLDEAELDEYLFDPDSREQNLEDAANVAAEEAAKTSKISGALAGAIAAGAAAVTAAVGTAGLMIYNGVSNKDELAKLWTSEEDSFFSRLGKTVSILFKGAKEGEGYDQSTTQQENNEEGSSLTNSSAGQANDEQTRSEEQTQPTEAPVEEQTSVVEEKPCKYGENEETLTCDAELKQEISSLKDYQQKEAERLAQEEAERKANEEVILLKNKKTVLRKGVNSLQGRIDALKEEHKGDLQDELDTVKATIENATSVEELEGVEGQLTTLEGKVAKAEAVQQDTDEVSNGREKNPTTISVEEKKEPFTHTFTAQPCYRYEKKHVQKKIDEIKNTCGLNTTNLQNQLNSINLKNVATIDELRAAEESIIKFGEKITSLLNSCKTINSNKGYIENNIQAVVDILDKSDVSLDHDWDELKNKPVTEGNVGELAEGYTTIAGRVKAILDNNKAISTSTGKISTAIEGNKDLEWFDGAYYNGQLDEISKKAKTEESLPGIKNEVEELAKKLNGVETANKLDGEINELISGFDNYKTSYKTQYGAKYQVKCEELKKEHDLSKVVNELETFKKDLEARLNNLKTFCENRPEKCGKK